MKNFDSVDMAFLLFIEVVILFFSYLAMEMNKIPFWKALILFHLLVASIGAIGFLFVYVATKKL